MPAIAAHLRANLLGLIRLPKLSVAALLAPSFLYLLLAAWPSSHLRDAPYWAASFAGVVVFGCLYSAYGRVGAGWSRYLRTLPLAPRTAFAARGLSSLVPALAAAGILLLTASAMSHGSTRAELLTQGAKPALAACRLSLPGRR